MSEKEKNNPFLTATYQNIFIMDLRQINECYFAGDYKGSFEALKILYSDLLEKPRREVEKDWRNFLKKLNGIEVTGINQMCVNISLNRRIIDYLYKNIPEIKSRFILVLEKNNLLNLELGAKPLSRSKPHIGAG